MMTSSIFKINVPQQFNLSTRPQGVQARSVVLEALDRYGEIELDFDGKDPTPSFADECIGVLCRNIGWARFKQQVHFANLTDTSKSLLKVVISRRRREEAPSIVKV